MMTTNKLAGVPKSRALFITLGLELGLGSACNQADPLTADAGGTLDSGAAEAGAADAATAADEGEAGSGATGGTDGGEGAEAGDGTGGAAAEYFPLVDGATWTYRHVAPDMTVWNEIVTMSAVQFGGGPAFEMRDNPDLGGETTVAILARDGSRVSRVHKEVLLGTTVTAIVDYDPGFLRVDDAWQEGDRLDWMYDRSETDGAGAPTSDATRQQIYTVESLSESVTVPAGTFDCIQFVRERGDTGERKRFWFADGVGKVKHENLETGTTEELVEFSIP